jgi:4'-phosphopantetheinyl transferase EntD
MFFCNEGYYRAWIPLTRRSERQHKAHIELTHKPTISERSQQLAQEMVTSESKTRKHCKISLTVGYLLHAVCWLLSAVCWLLSAV